MEFDRGVLRQVAVQGERQDSQTGHSHTGPADEE